MSNRPVMQALQSVGITLHGLRRQMERDNHAASPAPQEYNSQNQQEEPVQDSSSPAAN